MRLPLAIARLSVLACVAASAVFAWRFGWTRGATDVDRWIYGGGAVALDLLKATTPLLAVQAWHAGKVPTATAAWFAFTWLTAFSLMCASGLTATQLATKFANQASGSTDQANRQATLDRLVSTRKAMPVVSPTSEEVLSAANAGAVTATNQRIAECGPNNESRGRYCKDRERDEREARDRATAAASNRAVTRKVEDLDAQIAAAEESLSKVDVKTATMQVDPQAASMARAIGTGQEPVALVLHVILAISIEIGSGLGVWLAFGHARPEVREIIDGRPTIEPIWATTSTPSIEGPSDGSGASFKRWFVLPRAAGSLGPSSTPAMRHGATRKAWSR